MKKTLNLDHTIDTEDGLIKIPIKELMKLYINNDMKDPVLEIVFNKSNCYYEGTVFRFDHIDLADGEKVIDESYYW